MAMINTMKTDREHEEATSNITDPAVIVVEEQTNNETKEKGIVAEDEKRKIPYNNCRRSPLSERSSRRYRRVRQNSNLSNMMMMTTTSEADGDNEEETGNKSSNRQRALSLPLGHEESNGFFSMTPPQTPTRPDRKNNCFTAQTPTVHEEENDEEATKEEKHVEHQLPPFLPLLPFMTSPNDDNEDPFPTHTSTIVKEENKNKSTHVQQLPSLPFMTPSIKRFQDNDKKYLAPIVQEEPPEDDPFATPTSCSQRQYRKEPTPPTYVEDEDCDSDCNGDFNSKCSRYETLQDAEKEETIDPKPSLNFDHAPLLPLSSPPSLSPTLPNEGLPLVPTLTHSTTATTTSTRITDKQAHVAAITSTTASSFSLPTSNQKENVTSGKELSVNNSAVDAGCSCIIL
mmetsp:Transcript_15098/g.22043  ORF Transcript_15098/g.22043 Transcript_15098/m.22043 type:complete len:399 (-) Transcript_15098:585-1781(-)